MNETSNPLVTRATSWAKWLGFALIGLGVLALVLPRQSGSVVAVTAGVLLLLSGVTRISFLFLAPTWGSVFMRSIFGLASVLAGIMMITDPVTGLNALTIVAIVYFLLEGLTDILMGFQIPPGGGGLWVVAGGILSLILGIMIWRSWPVSGEVALPMLIGIKLIANGIMILAVAGASKAILNPSR